MTKGGRVRGMVVGVLVLACGPVWAQEGVLYCIEDGKVGFDYRKDQRYQRTTFTPERFTIKVEEQSIVLNQGSDAYRMECRAAYGEADKLACTDFRGYSMNFDVTGKRFILTKAFGYFVEDGDSVAVSIGTCASF